jgi:2-(1,2-epoxy-1,2-dihydrophenyl)acetyl-CoA isomerase
MSLETVLYSLDNGVATIQMNRPDALNALSLQLGKDLAVAIHQAIADEARAAILTGSGRAFCSGGDLREMKAMGESERGIEAFLDEPLKALHEVIRLMRETPIPVHRGGEWSLCRSRNELRARVRSRPCGRRCEL